MTQYPVRRQLSVRLVLDGMALTDAGSFVSAVDGSVTRLGDTG